MPQAPGGTGPSAPNPHVVSDTQALSSDIPNTNLSEPDQVAPTVLRAHEPIDEGEEGSQPVSPDPSDGTASESGSSHTLDSQTPVENPPSETSPSGPFNKSLTRIVLEQGFDQLPAALHLLKRQEKSICFWRQWGSHTNVVHLIKNHVLKVPVVPESFKQHALKAAADKFAERSEGILLWPAYLPFQGNLDNSVQIIHLGEPFKENTGLETAKVVVVIARSGWTDLSSETKKAIDAKYPLDPMNRAYNRQRAASWLEAERQHVRSYLTKRKAALGFFTAWIISERKHNPTWSAKKLADRANRYAAEYLLYGGRGKKKERLGGKFYLEKRLVTRLDLWPAVHAHILRVH